MTRKTPVLLLTLAVAAACGRSQSVKRGNQNYQVVEEGQASGVTSTINGPGETPPPATDTAVDTTTNFTLDNPAPMGTQPASVAGTFPVVPSASPYPSAPPQPRPVRPSAPPAMSSNAPAPQQTKSQQQAEPQQTETVTTTQTPADTAEKPKKEAPPKQEEQTETTDTSTTTTPPPPPPPPV